MKRNKQIAKGLRSGVSPYAKHKKRPDQTLQAITRASKENAMRGQAKMLPPMEEPRASTIGLRPDA